MTPKQAMFVAEFLIDGNATRAAVAAGFKQAGAHVTGARLLKNAKVAAAIKERQQRRAANLELSADRVDMELMRLAYYDPGKLYDADGNRIPVHLLDEDTRRAVASAEDESVESTDKKGTKTVRRDQRIRMADKGANLERLAKRLNLYGDSSASAALTVPPGGLPAGAEITVTLVRPDPPTP